MARTILVCRAVIHGGSGNDLEDDQVPPSLAKIHNFFNEHNDQQGGRKTCEMYSKHLRANFCPVNIPELAKIVSSMDDIEADSVDVTGFQYQNSNLPSVNAVATFRVPFKRPLTNDELAQWESAQDDALGFCVNFWWEFDDIEDEEWESYLDDNSGIEFSILE